MSQAIAGHGATIAMEQDPSGAQGTFTVVAELNGDISPPGLQRTATEVTPHQDDIDSSVYGVLRRTPMSFSVNYIFDNATHDHLTGMTYAIKENETRGFRIRGPAGATDSDEWIASGNFTNVGVTNPVRDGARTADVEVVMSGAMIIDGAAFGVSS